MARRNTTLLIAVLVTLLAIPLSVPVAHAQETQESGAKPVKVNDPVPEPVKNFALEEADPSDATTSPNPRLAMTILDGSGNEIVNAIPILEDAETDFFANSEIFSQDPPATMDGAAFTNARWLKPATVMWTIDEVARGKSSLGKSNSYQYQAGFKNPGEYLLSCFAYRDFTYSSEGREFRLTALSSRGIACFVADATPPSFSVKFTEYKTGKRSSVDWMEFPPDIPVGSKSWELVYDGVHFDPAGLERKTGRLRGELDRETKVDLTVQKNVPRLIIKKGLTYLLNVEGKDNYMVGKTEWDLVNTQKKSILTGGNVQKFQLADDAPFVGEHILVIFLQDKGGNSVEVKLPVRIVPK